MERDGQGRTAAEGRYEEAGQALAADPAALEAPSLAVVERLSTMATVTAGAVREISAPLGYALAYIAHLERELERVRRDPPPASVQDLVTPLREVRLGVQRARDIARDAFALPNPQHETPTHDLRRVLLSCIKMARLELEHGARVVLELDALPSVRGSETRLSQIFYNILSNAFWAACQTDGDPIIRVTSYREEGMVAIDIADSGPGISAHDLERVFEPFFTTRAGHDGAGLGLAICRHLAHEIGGHVEATSGPATGATFRVRLPAAEAPLPETERAIPSASFESARPRVRSLHPSGRRSDGHGQNLYSANPLRWSRKFSP